MVQTGFDSETASKTVLKSPGKAAWCPEEKRKKKINNDTNRHKFFFLQLIVVSSFTES